MLTVARNFSLKFSINKESQEIKLNPENARPKLQQMTFYFFYLNLSKEIRLDVSCESSA